MRHWPTHQKREIPLHVLRWLAIRYHLSMWSLNLRWLLVILLVRHTLYLHWFEILIKFVHILFQYNGFTISIAKRVRGSTRGKAVQGLVDRDGKLSVPIPPEFCAPVGDYASKLASKIGVKVQTYLPDPSVYRWKYVDASVKEAMFQRLNVSSLSILL